MNIELQPEYKQMIADKRIAVGNNILVDGELVEVILFDIVKERITVKHSDNSYSTFINEPFWRLMFQCEKDEQV